MDSTHVRKLVCLLLLPLVQVVSISNELGVWQTWNWHAMHLSIHKQASVLKLGSMRSVALNQHNSTEEKMQTHKEV